MMMFSKGNVSSGLTHHTNTRHRHQHQHQQASSKNSYLEDYHSSDENTVFSRVSLSQSSLPPTPPTTTSTTSSLTRGTRHHPSGRWNKKQQIPQTNRIASFIKQTFLPIGYPQSVPSEYSQYQGWNLLQDLCSYLRGIMATNALLVGMGVGRTDVTAIQATIQWILRDGASLLGGLLFTSLSSYQFGRDVKTWRLFADMINNLGITLDMVASYWPRYFLGILCLGSLCKALCGVAAGATNAAIAVHWGEKRGNIADVLAKNGAQHTLVSLIGLAISLPFARFAGKASKRTLWLLYGSLTLLHIVSNYKVMRVLALRSFNLARFQMVIDSLLSSPVVEESLQERLKDNNDRRVSDWLQSNAWRFTPAYVAKREPILSLLWKKQIDANVRLWCRPSEGVTHVFGGRVDMINKLQEALNRYHGVKYFILSNYPSTDRIAVCFQKDCSLADQAKAMLEVTILQRTLCMEKARLMTEQIFDSFWKFLKELDWKLDSIQQLKPQDAFAFLVTSDP
eukprot:scaffold3058_cov165-Ochromonas_danica.AAC.24